MPKSTCLVLILLLNLAYAQENWRRVTVLSSGDLILEHVHTDSDGVRVHEMYYLAKRILERRGYDIAVHQMCIKTPATGSNQSTILLLDIELRDAWFVHRHWRIWEPCRPAADWEFYASVRQ